MGMVGIGEVMGTGGLGGVVGAEEIGGTGGIGGVVGASTSVSTCVQLSNITPAHPKF